MSDFAGSAQASADGSPGDFDWLVRAQVYAGFARDGRCPTLDDLTALTDASASRVRASLLTLHAAHQLAVSEDGGSVLMAHPFSARPTAYPVQTRDFTCYANCAWDALAVPVVLGKDGWTSTSCAATGTPLQFGVKDGTVEGDTDAVIHFLTPLRHAWDDIGFT